MENTKLTVAHKSSGDIKNPEEKALYNILKKLPTPSPRMNLSKNQKYWWKWFGVEFISTNQFSKVDLQHLQSAAVWMDARCQAIEKINEKGYAGLVQTFAAGATNISGHLTIVEKADKQLDKVSAHFGLSIRDRQKLKVEKADSTQLSLFETVMNKLAN